MIYAHTLGMLGDAMGASLLAETVGAADWDKGWNFRGMGQYGASRSRLDSLVLALGRTKDKQALPILTAKARQLTGGSEFSHCRAVAVALEQMPDPSAAPALSEALDRVSKAAPHAAGIPLDRNLALKKITLARALYRCGDKDGLARRTLTEFLQDERGPFAQHAAAVLASPPR